MLLWHRRYVRWTLTVGVVAFVGGWGGHSQRVWADDELFVTSGGFGGSAVRVYARTASGDAAPLRTISGFPLMGPIGLALDTVHNEMFVGNTRLGSNIAIYPLTAHANDTPSRIINGFVGFHTTLDGPFGLAIDTAHDELFVANHYNDSILVYSIGADDAVSRAIQGPATGLNVPWGLALDTTLDELFVANQYGDSITVYSRTASGNAAPLRTITGPDLFPHGLAPDPVHDELVVANSNSIMVYSRTASGNAAPLRKIQGHDTGLADAQGVTVDLVNDELLVANNSNHSITVYSRTASGNAAPLRTLNVPLLPSGCSDIEVVCGPHSVAVVIGSPPPPPGTATLTVMPPSNGTVTGPGINCPGDCSESYGGGASVSLTATPTPGFTFGGFSGDPDCADGILTMNADTYCAATFTLTPASLPDLTGTWNPVSQSCGNGKCRLKGSVRVVNQGTATASASRLRIHLSDDATLDPSDAVLKETKIEKLRPGRETKSKMKVMLPAGVSTDKYLLAIIDTLDLVVESDETNNSPSTGPMP